MKTILLIGGVVVGLLALQFFHEVIQHNNIEERQGRDK